MGDGKKALVTLVTSGFWTGRIKHFLDTFLVRKDCAPYSSHEHAPLAGREKNVWTTVWTCDNLVRKRTL